MKRYITILLLLAITMFANAQKITSGSLDYLKKGDVISVRIDYSNAEIMEMSDKEYADYETNWEPDGKKKQLICFINGLREDCDDYKFTTSEDGDATLTFYVKEIKAGRMSAECSGKIVIKTKEGNEIVMEKVEEGAKTFGTKLHIMEKAITELGETIGEKICK